MYIELWQSFILLKTNPKTTTVIENPLEFELNISMFQKLFL